MKVKLLDPGFANFTGHFGSVAFTDGVSEDVSGPEAQRMGSIMRVEVVGTGENPSITQLMVDTRNQNMSDIGGTKTLSELDAEAKAAAKAAEKNRKKLEDKNGPQSGAEQNGGVPVASPADLDWTFEAEDLKALVAKQGIAGLRTFAEPYGVKGRAVKGIIEDLLAAKQQNFKPAEADADANDVIDIVDDAPAAPAVDPSKALGEGTPEGTEFLDDDEPAAPEVKEAPASEAAEAPGTGEGFIDENESDLDTGSIDDDLAELEAELNKE